MDNNKYYKGKYRIQSNRKEGWDYSTQGYYFMTICVGRETPWRVCTLSNIINDRVELCEIGVIIDEYINQIPLKFLNAVVDKYVIMPNHLHLIIQIINYDMRDGTANGRDTPRRVCAEPKSTDGLSPLMPNSIPSIVNHLKGHTKKWCNQNGFENFQWQRNYHERIIRNDEALYNIRNYIDNNPQNWHNDKLYKIKQI